MMIMMMMMMMMMMIMMMMMMMMMMILNHAIIIGIVSLSLAPGKQIIETLKKLASTEQEVNDLKSRLEESEELHRIDLEVALDALREDLTKTQEERMEKVRQECM